MTIEQPAAAGNPTVGAVTATTSLQTIFKIQGIIILVFLVIWAIAGLGILIALLANN